MQNFLFRSAPFGLVFLLALGCLLSQKTAEAQSSIRDGLVAEWNFDEISGLTASDSAGDNDGELMNFPDDDSHWVEGKVGGAIVFDGSNYVEVPHADAIGAEVTEGLTVMAWFRSNVPLDASGAGNRMLEKGNNYFFLQGVRPGGMNFLIKHGGANFTAGIEESLAAETWYHIAGVFDGATSKTYIDGELKGSVEVPVPIDDSQLPLRIGSDDGNSFFNGQMDQVLIWKRPLSSAEIRAVIDGDFELPPQATLPEIASQPQNQTLYEGGTAMLSVAADGIGVLRYLWHKDGEPLRAATEPALVIPDVSQADAGEYTVRIQNDHGEVISNAAVLSVTPVEGLNTGRAGYWAFDETSGESAADGSGNGLAGVLLGFPDDAWTSGQVNNGLDFDGFGSVVAVDDDTALNELGTEATFSFWIRLNSYGEKESAGTYDRSAGYVLRKGNHFGIRVINDPGTVTRTIVVRRGSGQDPGSVVRKGWEANLPQGSVELDVWQHFTIVYKGGFVFFYKNGFPIGEAAEGGLGEPGSEVLAIGGYDNEVDSVARYLNGVLDELSIWARPLRESEILEAAGKDVSGPPVVEVQPVSQKRLEGASAVFQIVATGKRPVRYQWLKDGAPIEGATENRLTLIRLLPKDAGLYSVQVANDQGETVSQAAALTVEELDNIASGLAAHYSFDSVEGDNLLDAGDNELNGTLFNFGDNPLIDEGIVGKAISFDGVDDFIEISHNDLLTLGTEATISVWLNPVLFSGGSDFDRVFRKDVNYDFVLINGGIARLHGVNKTPYSTPPNTVSAEVWQHFAYIVKNGAIHWYHNGEAVGEPLSGKLGEVNSNPLVIGNYEVQPAEGDWINRPYQGLMDDLGIWQRALSPNDILSIYHNGLNGKPLSEGLAPLRIQDITIEDGALRLVFFTPFANRSHAVQMKTTLAQNQWNDLANLVPSTLAEEGLFEVTFSPPTDDIGFYQVVSLPPPPLFFDDFESGAPGWTHGGDKDEWELGTPQNGPGAAFSGSNCYGTDLDGDFEPFTDAYLRSPEIDLSRVSVATLSFAEFHSVDIEEDYHSVSVNIIDAASNDVLQEVFREAGAVNGWTQHSIRLAGPSVGGKIKIEFLLQTDDVSPLPGFYIDDVSIQEN